MGMKAWEIQDYSEAAERRFIESDVAAVKPHQIADDREAKSGAWGLAVPALADIEDDLEGFRWQSRSVIIDGNTDGMRW